MADNPLEDLQNSLRDALYVTVGLGVIAFQKAQVQRTEYKKQLETNISEAQKAAAETVQTIDERLSAVEERIDDALDDLQGRLPEQAQTALSQARTAAKDTRAQLRGLLLPSS